MGDPNSNVHPDIVTERSDDGTSDTEVLLPPKGDAAEPRHEPHPNPDAGVLDDPHPPVVAEAETVERGFDAEDPAADVSQVTASGRDHQSGSNTSTGDDNPGWGG